MATKPHPPLPCPFCAYMITMETAVDGKGAAPVEGDISICINCGQIGIYEHGAIRKSTDQDIKDLSEETLIELVRAKQAMYETWNRTGFNPQRN